MKTYIPNAAAIERKWYVVDATDKTLGRLASEVANVLSGKNKPTFTPNVDCGDHVIVINCSKAVFTGRKLEQKKYYHHSEYLSGLRVKTAREMMETTPEKVMYLAVKGMLPANTLGRKALTRLRAYAGADHNNAAQKPVAYEG